MSAPRSKIQCESLSSSAARGWASSGRSKSRWTLTIGECSSAGIRLAEQPGSLVRRRRDDHGIRVEIVEGDDALAGADGCAGCVERAARSVAVHPAQGPRGQDDVARLARREQRRTHREHAPFRAHLIGAEVERRADEDVPEAVDRLIRTAELAQQRAERLRRPSRGRGAGAPPVQHEAGRRAGGGGSEGRIAASGRSSPCGRPRAITGSSSESRR